ncbi:MAG TPA: TonB-dependent receptor [Gammaproteobacteria bacterium]|nr:TonB-dependent receptor [Gammaproteobacteria bacterium]
MARRPAQNMPKTCQSSIPGARRRSHSANASALLALVLAAGTQTAALARDCEEHRADLVIAEGTIEVRRVGGSEWVGLALGETVCPGDSVRALAFSRATLRLSDQTLLRVDQQSTLTLAEPDDAAGFLVKLVRGVIHVISRDPRSLSFSTPHVNAGLKGTEFDIRVDEADDRTEVAVLEGRVEVTNATGRIEVPSGFVATAHAGEMPKSTSIAEPIDLMRWASYFPAIVEGPLPSPGQEPSGALANDPHWLAARAAARLEHGDLAAAEADLAAASSRAPSDATVLALRAVAALGRNDIVSARASAQAAASSSPSPVALIALSLVRQADNDLAGALASARAALDIAPENAIAWARRADLELQLGDSSQSLDHARHAIGLQSSLGYAHSVLGFVLLNRLDIDGAIASFEHGIALDQGAPLPQLGLALALMQRGDLVGGRQHLELAVALDPSNGIVRSYMGKTYDAEHRARLPASQLDLAKHFDPSDPTPWLYSALVKLNRNQPIEAFDDLLEATGRNDNVAPSRSRLAGDPDLATRSAGTGHVLRDLGFEQLALVDGWSSASLDPADYAAHRLLGDIYSSAPRHDFARVSEVLTSQLLQPINVTPIRPQLGQVGAANRAGPTELASSEFAPLVTTNGLRFELSSVSGTNDTFGEDVVLAGLHDRVSYSVGQFHYSTDGFRPNSDVDERIGNAFVQFSPSDRSTVQAELRSYDLEEGDISRRFDPNLYVPDQRLGDSQSLLRIGGRQKLDDRDTLFGTLFYQTGTTTADFGGGSPKLAIDSSMRGADVQTIHEGPRWNVRSGVAYVRQIQTNTSPSPGETALDTDVYEKSAYAYADVAVGRALTLDLGAAADFVSDPFVERSRVNPKLGVTWRPSDAVTLRAAAFQTLQANQYSTRPNAQPRLEPVQVAGFNQFLLGSFGDEATVYGLGLDTKVAATMFAGVEVTERDIDGQTVLFDSANQPYNALQKATEETGRAYFYWAPRPMLSLSAQFQAEHVVSDPFSGYQFTEMRSRRVPIEARYFGRTGLNAGLRVSHYHEEGLFLSSTSPLYEPGEDDFWVTDVSLGFRLPKRRGVLSLNIDNLFNKDFHYQDIDQDNPSVVPERAAYFRFTLSFQ